VNGYQAYSPQSIPTEVLLMLMQQQEMKRRQQEQQEGDGIGLGELVGALGAENVASSLFSSSAPIASTAAQNAAWNAGATAAGGGLGTPATPTLLSASRVPASGTTAGVGVMPYMGAAAALGGAYQLNKSIKNRDTKGGAVGGGLLGGGLAAAAPLVGLGPVGWTGLGLAAVLGAGGGAGLTKLLGHKSTKEYQREKWGKLAKASDTPTAEYAKQYLNYLGSDRAKEDAKYENTFDGKKAAGNLRAEDVWGGEGIFKTFGSDWLGKYNENQRRDISQALLDNDLLYSSKGDISVRDASRAKEVASNILNPTTQTKMQTQIPGWVNEETKT
jgi:hypothetical protein